MKITRESIINVEEREKVIAKSWYVIRTEKEALMWKNEVFEKMYLSHVIQCLFYFSRDECEMSERVFFQKKNTKIYYILRV